MSVKITWLGHACFLFEDQSGTRVLTDPFNKMVGYPVPEINVAVVTVSHEHSDHNAVQILPGNPAVIRGPGTHNISGLTVKGIATFHDGARGSERGSNTVFVIEMENIKICHLGDLGHQLDAGQAQEIGSVDVLLVPVGGTFTIDSAGAKQVVEALRPKLAIPMHYHTEMVKLPISPVENFTNLFQNVKEAKFLELSPVSLPDETEVVVLELSRAENKSL
ncbi:MAG: MBL fold metallo-hydrolase [Peptococcaceae bacterium]|nr:MAG: MBL fold metallo-hydrolase [Peptococcaceae bacterium]